MARAVLAALLLTGACWVALPARPSAATDAGWLRLAHLSPDTPAVDVVVSPAGSPAVAATSTGLRYGSVSAWHRLAAGAYTVAVRAAGTATSTAPVLSTRVDLAPGGALTVALAGPFAALRLAPREENLSPPAAGRARVQVVDAASAGPLGVAVAGGPVLAAGLRLGTSGQPVEVPGGRTALRVTGGDASPQPVSVDLAGGSVTTLLLLDGAGGGLTVRPVLDAGGPSATPAGAVPAGGGGTAGGFPLRLVAAMAAGLAGALLLATFRPRRRRG